MKRSLTLAIVPVLGALLLSATPASAQNFKQFGKIKVNFNPVVINNKLPVVINKKFPVVVNKQFPIVAVNNHYHVQYRQLQWKTRDFFCHIEAHQFENSLKARGYQAYVEHHGQHYHVRYRFTNWRTYRTVDCHQEAHELENYLRSQGYQARVVHH